MAPALLCLLIAATNFAADIPPGTDLAVRIEVGKCAPDARVLVDEVRPFVDAWPPVKQRLGRAVLSWANTRDTVAKQTGANFDGKDVVLTLNIDLDAAGGAIVGGVVRGARPRPTTAGGPGVGLEAFLVEGQPATRFVDRDLAFCIVGRDTLVIGDARGLQRQVRHLLLPTKNQEPIMVPAGRLRDRTPVAVALALSPALRDTSAAALPHVGPLVRLVRAGNLAAKPKLIHLELLAGSSHDQVSLLHGVRALAALLRTAASALEGGAQAALALSGVGARPAVIPAALDDDILTKLSDDWLKDFTISAAVHSRPGNEVEAELSVSSVRGILAALGVVGLMLAPALFAADDTEVTALLLALRRLELGYRKANGKLVACGPVPASLPEGAVAFPKPSCFDPLGFTPAGMVRYQVSAAVEKGKLVLTARGDVDGDGAPEVWVLEEGAIRPHRLLPPATAGDEPSDEEDTYPAKMDKTGKTGKAGKYDKAGKSGGGRRPEKSAGDHGLAPDERGDQGGNGAEEPSTSDAEE